MDVYLREAKTYGARPWHYQVWVDGRVFDTFDSTTPLTWSQQWDVAAGYREALTGAAAA